MTLPHCLYLKPGLGNASVSMMRMFRSPSACAYPWKVSARRAVLVPFHSDRHLRHCIIDLYDMSLTPEIYIPEWDVPFAACEYCPRGWLWSSIVLNALCAATTDSEDTDSITTSSSNADTYEGMCLNSCRDAIAHAETTHGRRPLRQQRKYVYVHEHQQRSLDTIG